MSSQLAASESYVPIYNKYIIFIVDFYTYEVGYTRVVVKMWLIFINTFVAVSPVPSLYPCCKYLYIYTSEENLCKLV